MSRLVQTSDLPVSIIYDATANNSSKSWVIGTTDALDADEFWRIQWIHVIFAATATVGNRKLRVAIIDPSANTVLDVHNGLASGQAATTTYHYSMYQGVYRETSVIDTSIHMPIPKDMVVPNGYTMKVYDSAAIDAAADDMTVSIAVERYVSTGSYRSV